MSAISLLSFMRFSLQLIVAEIFFLKGKPKKPSFVLQAALSLSGYIVTGLAFHFLMHVFVPDLIVTQIIYWIGLLFLTMAGIMYCYDLMPIEILFIGTGGYAAEHIAYSLMRIFKYTVWGREEMNPVIDNLLLRCVLYLVVYVIIYYVVIYPNKEEGEFRKRDIRLFLMMIAILFSAIILSTVSTYSDIIGSSYPLSEIVCPLYSLLCCLFVLLIDYYVLRENRLSHENEVMEQMLQMARTQQKSSKEAINIINIKCHDLKHQMKILENADSPLERKEYIQEIKKAISIYDATYQTGCDTLDYLLREKALFCEEFGLAFSCMADGEILNFMNATDLYAIMGNALDNAIEGANGVEEENRIISLRIQKKGSMAVVHLENTCGVIPDFTDGLPVTTKKDKNYHGFGVKSIVYIVEKYNGYIRMKAEKHKFYLDVLIPIPD